jgi:hypothetical protein
MEKERVVHALAEEVYLRLHHLFEIMVGIYMQWGSAPKQCECRYQANEPETVVTMQVRNEDVVDEREVYVITAQLQLRAFAAVNHELLVPNFYNLCRGIVSCCGQCRTTT